MHVNVEAWDWKDWEEMREFDLEAMSIDKYFVQVNAVAIDTSCQSNEEASPYIGIGNCAALKSLLRLVELSWRGAGAETIRTGVALQGS